MVSAAEGDVRTGAELASMLQWRFSDRASTSGRSPRASQNRDSHAIHLVHTFTDLAIASSNFGNQLYHSLPCTILQFLILRRMGGTVTAVLTTFGFPAACLLAGYYYPATGNNNIKSTMPPCVLTLKLIALAVDYFDGRENQNSLSSE
ncbi:hypothetical protein HJG60_010307 [Phyllostomus discolor]|uniref:Uncharacterized protein n=1 Tax=Phyllostomus discolor TaxID=89673 RepID=A0A834AWR5_9CHIR|nr:hypothetical protein HJG60_010307 [Phyllostomus discolor]